MKKLQQIILLITCILVVMVAAIQRDGKIWGHELKESVQPAAATKTVADTMHTLDDGTIVINTTELGKDIMGYGGQIPLEIYIQDGKIREVKALDNSETPDFFEEAKAIITKWNGKTVEEAADMKVDAVSGATFSSRGIIGNMQRGLAFASKNASRPSLLGKMDFSAKSVIGLIVVLMAAIIPLFYKNKSFRTFQLVLNVVVLGFWCGTFLSWSLFVNFMSSGINVWVSLIPIVMLITAFVYPLFGKKNYYCTHVCPCGSVQDLAAKTKNRKWRMSAKLTKRLGYLRQALFAVLMVLMLSGVLFEWMDYEVFSAFIFQTASVVVLALGIVVVALSFFIPRPYCRFVCPTGTLFKLTEDKG
ncbi:FMN-binding protein [Prevotella sp. HUN102]|uniref:FMN-binding protein n=1 Tax=Prevotella sp. HUN102 TaxID=1392486 RepID=UPI000490A60F|nr:FMN-binding protein [Prevotella sp. HUN102]